MAPRHAVTISLGGSYHTLEQIRIVARISRHLWELKAHGQQKAMSSPFGLWAACLAESVACGRSSRQTGQVIPNHSMHSTWMTAVR